MRFRSIAMMALSFLQFDKKAQETLNSTKDYKKALEHGGFQNVNIAENPIFFPSKTMKINRARRLKRVV